MIGGRAEWIPAPRGPLPAWDLPPARADDRTGPVDDPSHLDGYGRAAQPRSLGPCDAAMTRYAAGEEAAFAIVYDELSPRLYGFLLRQTRDVARAEDVLQQTFLHMHRARDTFVRGSEVLPWAFAITRHALADSFRRGPREILLDGEPRDDRPAPGPGADELVAAQELARRIQEVLARLPEVQRVAFELVKQEGLSLAEAAQVLGTTVTAVKLRTHRAYEALRAVLGDVLAGDPVGRTEGST
jgi:RNA polymerase sigma-70 factor (ECF subfamily)